MIRLPPNIQYKKWTSARVRSKPRRILRSTCNLLQSVGTQIMEMLCDWNSFVAFHAGEVQATCAISSVVDLQNLLGTTLHVVLTDNESRLQHETQADTTESPPQQTAEPNEDSDAESSSLPALQPVVSNMGWLQPCSRQDHLRLGFSEAEAWAGNQSWEREEKTASNRSCRRVASQQQFEDLLNSLVCWWLKFIGFKIYSTHWSCESSCNIHSLSAQFKSWFNYKAYRSTLPYKCSGWLYWAAAECFLYEIINSPMK